MDIEQFRETLETFTTSELILYIHRYVCLSLVDARNPAASSHQMLDLLYAECTRRGAERLYDISYEHVCREPGVCTVLLAA